MAFETLVRILLTPKSARKRHSTRAGSAGRPRVTRCNDHVFQDVRTIARWRRSALACSDTRSWGRRTRTRSESSSTWPSRPSSCRGLSRSQGGIRTRSPRRRAATATSGGQLTGTTSSTTRGSDFSTTAVRTRYMPSRRSPPPKRGSTYSARSRLGAAVRLARELIDEGALGKLRHFRGRYLQDWGDDPTLDTWRFDPDEAGSGALGDLGTHVIDLARYLVGEFRSVAGLVKTFVSGRKVDDAIEAAVEFESGAVGTMEATRLALGRRNAFQWEINGSRGSLYFDMERMNELQVFLDGEDRTRGFRTVLVTEEDHPFMDFWWPPGHIVGWGDTFMHEVHHLLSSIADGSDVAPHGATFEDGYRASEIGEAIIRSSASGRREHVTFHS